MVAINKVLTMKTKVVNKYKEPYDVYIGRGSKWGNPYPITPNQDRKTVIQKYREYLLNNPELLKDLHELKGKTLGCFCKPKPCHGDILVEFINQLDRPKEKAMKQFNPMQYMAIDIANHYGLDKENYETRINWVKTNLNNLESFTDTADEPMLFAKSVHALRQIQQGKPTNHCVAFDSCNSGLQLMSIMMRDSSGAYLTGIGSDTRVDGYTEITASMNDKLTDELRITRKQSKEAVMTYLYGSQVVPKRVFGEHVELFHMTMKSMCHGAVELLNLLIQAWDANALVNQWVLPDNHLAYVPVMVGKSKRISVEESEFKYTPEIWYYENDTKETGISLAANVIHSVDAWVLRSLVRRCNYDVKAIKRFATLKQNKVVADDTLWFVERYKQTKIADIAMIPFIDETNVNKIPVRLFRALKRLAKQVLKYKPFEVICIHDSFACHPNHMNTLRQYYNDILADLCDSHLIDDLLNQLYGDKAIVPKGELTSDVVRNSNYALT